MQDIRNKHVLVTGASSGIGRACAKTFAAAGCQLTLIARRGERLEEIAADLRSQYGITIQTIVLDISDAKAVHQALAPIPAPDILINNAGLAHGLKKIIDSETWEFDDVIDTNVKGMLFVIHALVGKMNKNGSGDIINMGSIAGHETYPNSAVYCASKHAVNALTKGLRMDLIDTKLRVSSIDPGMVETEFSTVRLGDAKKAKNVYADMEPLVGADIADVAFYIATRPAHVQIANVVIFPTDQAAATMVHRHKN